MSESMVTRVAIAVSNVIREENGLPAKPAPLEGTRAGAIARAALAAIKTPTEAMLLNAHDPFGTITIFDLRKAWTSMVDAALKE